MSIRSPVPVPGSKEQSVQLAHSRLGSIVNHPPLSLVKTLVALYIYVATYLYSVRLPSPPPKVRDPHPYAFISE
jgi:hypothetical protein